MTFQTKIGVYRRTGLSDLDWKVVEMARGDGRRSANPDGLWARLSRNVFHVRAVSRLADDALEALRRFCVRAWYWDVIRRKHLHAFFRAGYSLADAFEILAHVAGHRGFSPSLEGLA
jgi:hypothetical protein